MTLRAALSRLRSLLSREQGGRPLPPSPESDDDHDGGQKMRRAGRDYEDKMRRPAGGEDKARFIHAPLWGRDGRRLFSIWVVDESAERYGEAHEERLDRQTYERVTRVEPFFRPVVDDRPIPSKPLKDVRRP